MHWSKEHKSNTGTCLMSLTAKTTTGILWNFGQQLAVRGISIIITLLLARFLVPEDFGLIAMMSIFLALGNSLMQSGFREALIRLEKVTQEDYATAFYANLLLGLISYCSLFIAAPFIATFYENPRLVELIRVASLAVIITSFQVVQIASLSRKLNFRAQLKANLPAGVISGIVAVYLAYIGCGVWALVGQTLLSALIYTVLLWKVEGWRPTLQFSWSSIKEMYGFGYKLFLSGILDIIFQNLYVLVIAKIFSAYTAGLYFFANKMKELIIQQLVSSIQSVTYPALASLQNDDLRLKQGYKKIVILMTMILFPGALFTAVLAEPIFQLILPEKWFPAVSFFQLLCIASLMMPLHSINLNILKVKGRSDLFLYLEIIKKSINGLVLFGTYKYGIHIIIFGQIATSFVNYIPNSYFSSKMLGYGIKEQITDFLPLLIITLVVSLFGRTILSLLNGSVIYIIFTVSITMIILYLFFIFLFQRSSFNLLFSFIKQVLNRGRFINGKN